eukprot:9915935-Lingulodinium_polyedra.AAC.1
MVKEGEEVLVNMHMIKMVAKFSEHHGWVKGPPPGEFVVSYAAEFLPVEAVDAVQPRLDGSATFLVHDKYVKELLRASGAGG